MSEFTKCSSFNKYKSLLVKLNKFTYNDIPDNICQNFNFNQHKEDDNNYDYNDDDYEYDYENKYLKYKNKYLNLKKYFK